jgi:hypothetical protein
VGSDGLIQTAAVNAPRFDHDPVTLASRGLLIEESRTNLLQRSEEFGTTWVTTNTTISSNTEVSPDGNATADTATMNNAGTNFLAQQVTVAASTQYIFSFYVKRGSATNATYSVFNNNANNDIVSATSYFSQTSSSAWVRVSFQFTTPVGCTSIFVYVLRNTGSTGSMHFWGAQLEAGSFATSYIPTVASSVVRSADVCSITGLAFNGMYNPTEGTMFVVADKARRASSGAALSLNNNNNLNRADIGFYNLGSEFTQYSEGAGFRFAYNVNATLVASNRVAWALAANNQAACINGATVLTNTSWPMLTASRLHIGYGPTGFDQYGGTISSIRYYRKRLSNAKLQSLTA